MVHRWQSLERAQLLKGRKLRDRQGELEDALIDLKVCRHALLTYPLTVADLQVASSAVGLSPCPPSSNPMLQSQGVHACILHAEGLAMKLLCRHHALEVMQSPIRGGPLHDLGLSRAEG